MYVTIVGTGYVGIVTAIGLATLGHQVHCMDIDHRRIQALSNGICPIYEKNIEKRLHYCLAHKLLSFDITHRAGDKYFFLTVGTPTLKNGNANLDQLFAAIDRIIEEALPNHTMNRSQSQPLEEEAAPILIIKSTVPTGTNIRVTTYVRQRSYYSHVVSNPEFLREGSALYDFLHPDRIIIGTHSSYAASVLTKIYQPLVDKAYPCLVTDPNTAELIKHASNAFLATKIAFSNELADLSERAKANISDLTLGVGLDKRIGNAYLKVGPGFGGSCLPKDIQALSTSFRQYGITSKILTAVISANTSRFRNIATKIETILGNLQDKIVTIYGLTFKANTDDTRESPAIKIIEALAAKQAMIYCYDPQAQYDKLSISNQYRRYIKCYNTPEEAISGADALIIATEWELFQRLNFDYIRHNMKHPIIIDLRNILDSHAMQANGFQYYCLGTTKA